MPARNEQDVLKPCLASLTAQSSPEFRLEREWELLIADDHSTDRTRQIAERFAKTFQGVFVLEPSSPPSGWTGKANALWTAAQLARGEWLLFTDADTIHQQGGLERAMNEAETAGVDLLSYSPRQLVSGFWQRALMPLIFAELAGTFPPSKVSDPDSAMAAANGQFLMTRRAAYFAVGGHPRVAGSLLEDVDLARLFKSGAHRIRFRYAPDAVSARMYRTSPLMIEGWTKNLALLFPQTLRLAVFRMGDLLLLLGLPLTTLALARRASTTPQPGLLLLSGACIFLLGGGKLAGYLVHMRRSNFSWTDCLLSIFALPLFSALLVRSWFRHAVRKQISWKGRAYATAPADRLVAGRK